jgi:serine acetyltransferase
MHVQVPGAEEQAPPPTVSQLIASDLRTYHALDGRQFGVMRRVALLFRAFLDRDFRIVFWSRISAHLVRGPFKFLALLIYFRVKSRYGVDISPWARIGAGLRLMHAFDIVIGPGATVGRFCCIFNGVTLGNSRPDLDGQMMPVIGDFCILGTGCKVLGNVQVPERTLLAANAVVTRSGSTDANGKLDLKSARYVADSYVRRTGGATSD